MTALAPRRGLSRLSRPLMRVAALVSVAFLAACDATGTATATGPQTGPTIDPSQPVPVALLVPGGGESAELDRIARSIVNSAKMAAADAQGARIDLRVYETGSDPALAVARANEAMAAGAKIIVGPLHADSANAVGQAVAGSNNGCAPGNAGALWVGWGRGRSGNVRTRRRRSFAARGR